MDQWLVWPSWQQVERKISSFYSTVMPASLMEVAAADALMAPMGTRLISMIRVNNAHKILFVIATYSFTLM